MGYFFFTGKSQAAEAAPVEPPKKLPYTELKTQDRIVNRNLNQRIRQALYALARQYGGSIDIYIKGSQSVDYGTGDKTINKNVTFIRRAIILPAKVSRESNQSISMISANKAFVYGGTYDSSTRLFIIDRRFVPNLPELTPDDWIVYNGRKYEIKLFEMAEFDSAYVITGKAVLGDIPEQIHLLQADSLLRLGDTVDLTVSKYYRLASDSLLELEQTAGVTLIHFRDADSLLALGQEAGVTLIHFRDADSLLTIGQIADVILSHPRDADSLLALGQEAVVIRSTLLDSDSLLALGQEAGVTLIHFRDSDNLLTLGQEVSHTGNYLRGPDSPLALGQEAAVVHVIPSIPFVTTWKTDNVGVSDDDQITLPLESGGAYDFEVFWGDGDSDVITVYNQAEVTHTYPSASTYTVTIVGTLYGFRFNNSGDKLKLLDVTQWGTMRVGISDRYFYGCSNLTGSATDDLDTTNTLTMVLMFRDATLFNGAIGGWDMSSITNISSMFYGATAFNHDIDGWDVSSVIRMSSLFRGATTFNQDIGSWVGSLVTHMGFMFYEAAAFNQDIGGWDVSSAEDMQSMFSGASAFDQDISDWDITSVTNMVSMFENVTLSTANYDALLIGWESQAVKDNVNFHGGDSKYSAGAAATARQALIDDHSWIITDGGQVP